MGGGVAGDAVMTADVAVTVVNAATDAVVVAASLVAGAALTGFKVASVCAVDVNGVVRAVGCTGSANTASDRPKRCSRGLLMACGLVVMLVVMLVVRLVLMLVLMLGGLVVALR